jgi:hypothetical protein
MLGEKAHDACSALRSRFSLRFFVATLLQINKCPKNENPVFSLFFSKKWKIYAHKVFGDRKAYGLHGLTESFSATL